MSNLYFGEQFEVSHTGNQVATVICDKCNCEYYYELARVGTGMANAHYGIGSAAAARRADSKSQVDLKKRLDFEAELVPCPKCFWINEDLVDGYRRGKFRNASWVAFAFALGGTLLSLVCVWFASMGPPADRGILPYLMYGGPAVSIVVGLAIFLISRLMRKTIRPNRNFPFAPKLPAGTPPAYVINEVGEIGKTVPHSNLVEGWQTFQLGRHELPDECCVCLEQASPKHSIKLAVETSLVLDVPRCISCAGRSRRSFFLIWLLVSAISVIVVSALCVILGFQAEVFWIVFGGLATIALALASYVAGSITAPVKMRVKDKSRGIVTVRFRNPEYAGKIED